jgi:hypothetical protein
MLKTHKYHYSSAQFATLAQELQEPIRTGMVDPEPSDASGPTSVRSFLPAGQSAELDSGGSPTVMGEHTPTSAERS